MPANASPHPQPLAVLPRGLEQGMAGDGDDKAGVGVGTGTEAAAAAGAGDDKAGVGDGKGAAVDQEDMDDEDEDEGRAGSAGSDMVEFPAAAAAAADGAADGGGASGDPLSSVLRATVTCSSTDWTRRTTISNCFELRDFSSSRGTSPGRRCLAKSDGSSLFAIKS